MIEKLIAIHEAGHAVAYLARGRSLDGVVIRDNETGQTNPNGKEGELPDLCNAIITLAGAMSEEVAFEKGLISETRSSLSPRAFRRAPLKEIDDDEKIYHKAICALQSERPGFAAETIDKMVRAETRAIVERDWNKIVAIAAALDARPWVNDIFRTGLRTKTLDGEQVERIFNSRSDNL
jgi:hypothetical protein